MKIVSNQTDNAEQKAVPYIYETLKQFDKPDSDEVLFNGVHWIYDKNLLEPYKDYKKRAILALWSPCECTGTTNYNHEDIYEFFTHVYCVCPYLCAYMNNYFGEQKFYYIPYPFTNYSVTKFYEYDSTCCWAGSIHSEDHIKAIETMDAHTTSYKFITTQLDTWMKHPYEFSKYTHLRLSTPEKLQQIAYCKSSLSFNLIYRSPASSNNNISCFNLWDTKGIAPQFKVRTHEIASGKSLLLVKKDPWNIIEDFYEPNRDFLYFETFDELADILHAVEKDWYQFRHYITRAFDKSMLYTVAKIYNYIKTEDTNRITWKVRDVSI